MKVERDGDKKRVIVCISCIIHGNWPAARRWNERGSRGRGAGERDGTERGEDRGEQAAVGVRKQVKGLQQRRKKPGQSKTLT